jgi:hypothetical protein
MIDSIHLRVHPKSLPWSHDPLGLQIKLKLIQRSKKKLDERDLAYINSRMTTFCYLFIYQDKRKILEHIKEIYFFLDLQNSKVVYLGDLSV